MSRIQKAIDEARRLAALDTTDWTPDWVPEPPLHKGHGPETLSEAEFCHDFAFGEPATDEEIAAAWGDAPIPADILELWKICSYVRLFVPEETTMEGIEFMNPADSKEETEYQMENLQGLRGGDVAIEEGDIVIGRFHGTSELLIRKAGAGPGIVQVPEILAERYLQWWVLGESIGEFIELYVKARGSFWWEIQPFIQPTVGTWPEAYSEPDGLPDEFRLFGKGDYGP